MHEYLVVMFGAAITGYAVVAIYYFWNIPSFFRGMEHRAPEIWSQLGRPKWYWHRHPMVLHRFIKNVSRENVDTAHLLQQAKRMRIALYWSYAFFGMLVLTAVGMWVYA